MQKRKSLRKSKVLLIRGPKFPWSGCKIFSSRAKTVFSLNTEKDEKKKNCNRHNRKKNKRFNKKNSPESCVEIEMKTFGDGPKNITCYSNEEIDEGSWHSKKAFRDVKDSIRIGKKGTNLHHSDSFTIYKQTIRKKKSKLKQSVFSKFSSFIGKKNLKKRFSGSIFNRFKTKRAENNCDKEAIKQIEGKIQYLSELIESKVENQPNKFVKFSPEEIQIDSVLSGLDGRNNSSILKNGKNVRKCVVSLENTPHFDQAINHKNSTPKLLEMPPQSIQNLLNKTKLLESCIQEISNNNENQTKLPMLQNVLGYASRPPPEAPQLQRFEKYLKQNKTTSDIIENSVPKPTKSLKEYFSTFKTSSLCKANKLNFQLSDMKSNTSHKLTNFFKTKKNKTEKCMNETINEQEMKTYAINESKEENFFVPNSYENENSSINCIFNQSYQNVGKPRDKNKTKYIFPKNNDINLHFNNNIDNYNSRQPKNKKVSQPPKNCTNNFNLKKYNQASDHSQTLVNSQNSSFRLISNHNNSKPYNATLSQNQVIVPKHASSPISITDMCENFNKVALSISKKVNSKKSFNLRESPSVENLFKPQEIRKQFDVTESNQFHNAKKYTAALNNYNKIKKLDKNFKLADDFCIKKFPLLTEENAQEAGDCCSSSSRSCVKSKSKIDIQNVDTCFHTPRQVARETDQFLAEQLQQQKTHINSQQIKKPNSRRPTSSVSRSRVSNQSLSRNTSLSRRNSNLNSENILERKNSFAWCSETNKSSNARKDDFKLSKRNAMHLVFTEKLDENGNTTSNQVFHCYDRLNKQQNNCPSQETLNNRSYKISTSNNNKALNRRVSVNSVAKSIKELPTLPGRGRGTRNHLANKKLKKSPANRRPGLVIKRQNSSRMFGKNVSKRGVSKEPDYLKTLTHWRNSKLATDESIILKESNFQKRHLENIFNKKSRSKNFNVAPNSSYSNFSAKNEKGDTDLSHAVDEVNSFTLFLEDYKLLGRISRGSFGQVLLAENNKLNFTCALRMVPKDLIIGDNDKIRVDTEFTNSYVPDVINKSPFFVHLMDIFQTENFFFFAMEFIDYCNLELILAFQGSFEYTQVKFYSAGIILALKYIHELDIIHRNIKLDNVLIDSKGYPRVTDFGRSDFGPIVKEVLEKRKKEGENTDLSSLTGIQYVAPEVFTMPSYDRMVDYWSLGVCIQYMLTGNLKKNWEEVIDYNNQLDDKYNQPVVKLLKAISVANPYSRLGMGQRGVDDVMKHSFYEVIDWEKYSEKHYYVPVPDPLCKTRHVTINSELFQDLSESLIAIKPPNHGEGFSTPNAFSSPEHCLANKITFISPDKHFQNMSSMNQQIMSSITFSDKPSITLIPSNATTPQFPSQNILQQNIFPICASKQNQQLPCQIISPNFSRTPIDPHQTVTPQLYGIVAGTSPLFRESPYGPQQTSELVQQPQIIYDKSVLSPIQQQVNVQQTLQNSAIKTTEEQNNLSPILQNCTNALKPIQVTQNVMPNSFRLLTEDQKSELIKQNIKEEELRMILKQQEIYRAHQEQVQKLDHYQMQQVLALRHQMLCNQKNNQEYSSGENTPSVNSIIFSKKKKRIKRIKKKKLRKKVNSVPLSPYTAPASPRSPYSPPLTPQVQNTLRTPNSSLGYHSKEEDFLMRLAELKYMYGSRHDFNINLPPISSVKRAIMANKDNGQINIDPKIRKYFDYYQQKILPQPKIEIPSNEDLKETNLDLTQPIFVNKNLKSPPETPTKKPAVNKTSILKAPTQNKTKKNKTIRPILKKSTRFQGVSGSSISSSSSASSN